MIIKHGNIELIGPYKSRSAATNRLRNGYPLPIGIVRQVKYDGKWWLALRRCSVDAWLRFPNPYRR